jgi:LysR family transcriptional activator of nhaA
LVLTDAGQTALQLADQIFQIGENLPELVRESASAPSMRLAVGISDGLPKLVARRLLQPVISEPTLRLICHEGELDELLGDLALHRLDVVFSDRPAPANPNIKLYSHAMGQSPMAWYGTPALVGGAVSHFPQCLASTPVLLPTAHTAVRARLDHWFEQQGVRPRIVGEFEDSALLNTFGASGMGIFPAAEWAEQDLLANYGVERLAPCEGVTEHFFAVGTEKKVQHPLVQRVLDGIA